MELFIDVKILFLSADIFYFGSKTMSFVRQPILRSEVEERLKKELHKLWVEKYSAKDIARILGFGVEGTGYEKLKPYHVYYYRQKFRFRKRREGPFAKGESRYKDKKEEVMPFEVFVNTLNEKVPPSTFYARRQRTYLILHYWTPLRKSEIYERTIDDFEFKKDFLVIHLLRKKKTYKPTVKDEPLHVPLGFPLMNEVADWLIKKEWFNPKTNPNNRPWNISGVTAWHYVNSVFEGYYPHFFRFNWITDALSDPETTIAEIVAKTGLHIVTVNRYIMSSMRLQKNIDLRKLEKLEKQLKELERKV